MITFKSFLNEKAKDKKPEYHQVDVEKAIAILNAHCKNALWMLKEDKAIYRGEKTLVIGKSGFAVVDTSATERQSQNTSNYYTVILDNHPDRQDFPKRSRSFVGTTSRDRAANYGGALNPYIIIPADDAKIGVVAHSDMWNTEIDLFGKWLYIEEANDFFSALDIPADINAIKDFAKKLKSGDQMSMQKLEVAMLTTAWQLQDVKGDYIKNDIKNNFMELIWHAYSAKSTGHKWYYTSNMPHDLVKTEVWVSGKCVLIAWPMWRQLIDTYHKGNSKPSQTSQPSKSDDVQIYDPSRNNDND
jgi:hypothetical protein